MKILLSTFSLERRAGSETWTVTMYNELNKLGHDVDIRVCSSEINNLVPFGCDKKKQYDLAIINHNKCLIELSSWNIKKRIFTSHGVKPDLEQPVKGADVYVSVSEEVQENLKLKGFDSVVIRNPIDTEYFTEVKPNDKLKTILWMNNREPSIDLIKEVSKGYDFRIQTGWRDRVKENIQWADIVMTAGRGIYESLSCGKNAIVVNWFGCDGIVTEENIYKLREKNCSGRVNNKFWPPERLREEFHKYNPNRNMRPYIIKNNNIKTIAERYLLL